MAPSAKAKKSVAIIGYGSQGRAIALNLKDSGHDPIVALRPRSKSRAMAKRDRIKRIESIPKAIEQADFICFAFPDHLHGRVFEKSIERYLRPKQMLLFLHGLSVHFEFLSVPDFVDVALLAPHAPGVAVRENYLTGGDVSAFYAIDQDASGKAEKRLFSLARGFGFKKSRLFETTFSEEALGDIFGEQAVLCGGLPMLIKSAFDTLVENGHNPDNAYLEVAYQLDLIVSLIKKHGITGMLDRVSVTAQLGALRSGPELINESVEARMQLLYRSIERGDFTKQLRDITVSRPPGLKSALGALSSPKLERAARKFSK